MSFRFGEFDTASVPGVTATLKAWPSLSLKPETVDLLDGAFWARTGLGSTSFVFDVLLQAPTPAAVHALRDALVAGCSPAHGVQALVPETGAGWLWWASCSQVSDFERGLWIGGVECQLRGTVSFLVADGVGWANPDDTASGVTRTNLVSNATFDSGTSGWYASYANLSWVDGRALMTWSSGAYVGALRSERFAVTPGMVLTAGADWGSPDDLQARIMLRFSNAGGSVIDQAVSYWTTAQRAVVTSAVPEGAVDVIILVWAQPVSGSPTAGMTAWVDDVTFEVGETDGSWFESGVASATITRTRGNLPSYPTLTITGSAPGGVMVTAGTFALDVAVPLTAGQSLILDFNSQDYGVWSGGAKVAHAAPGMSHFHRLTLPANSSTTVQTVPLSSGTVSSLTVAANSRRG